MNPPDGHLVPLGTHLIQVVEDTVSVTARGPITGDDMRALLDLFARVKRECGCLFNLYDARQCTGIDPEARKLASDQPSTNREADLQVVFGISFTIRVLLNMLIRAQKVLRDRKVNLYFFDGEIEARTFFEKERERIRREKALEKSL
jgi:hypothetical protein